MNVFAKLSMVKQLLRAVCTEEEMPELVTQAAKWHYDKKRHLTSEALKVYEVLINNSHNPYTVYRWLLLEKSPLELREKLQVQLITQRAASAQKKELQSLAATPNQKLLHDIIKCVERYVIR